MTCNLTNPSMFYFTEVVHLLTMLQFEVTVFVQHECLTGLLAGLLFHCDGLKYMHA